MQDTPTTNECDAPEQAPTVPAAPQARTRAKAPTGERGRHRRHANPFAMRGKVVPLDIEQVYGQARPLLLDVGCGPGAFVVGLARSFPNCNVLGLEIRAHLVDAGNASIAEAGLNNAHVALSNANTQLSDLLPNATFKQVTINFPDPWFKLRHHKRRVLSPAFAAWLASRMAPGGKVHFMTDVEALAITMRRTLTRAGFVDQFPAGTWPPGSTTGVISEREAWHASIGDPIWRAAFCPADSPARGPTAD